MHEIYLLTMVLALAAGLALFTKRLGLPMLVSYLGVGAILSAFHIVKPEELEFLAILPEIGLALLLFLVGMELDLGEFKSIGKKVFLATLGQVVVTTALLFSALKGFGGLDPTSALILAVAVSFSSTILVIKLLIEEKELTSLHGKLSVGILLVEDLIAVVLLMLMTVIFGSDRTLGPTDVLLVVGKGALLIGFALFAGKKLLPALFKLTADSTELLFLTAISWCLIFVSVSQYLEFSLAIGAFLAGVSLAQSVYRLQISGKIKPLRDFFIMIFFLDLGTGLSLSGLGANLWIGILFLIYAVFFKPIVFFLLFTVFRFRSHPSFQTGVYISSISEFSLIVIVLATKLHIVDETYLSPVIFATVFSFVLSSMLVTHRNFLYQKLQKVLKRFEFKGSTEMHDDHKGELKDHAVLVGCHRSGEIILKKLLKTYKTNIIVLDFNPEVVADLRERNIPCLYGDIADPEILEGLKLKEAELVISTVRDQTDNLVLLDAIEKEKSKATVIMTAEDASDAVKLYEKGAHYISLPMNLEGHNISHVLEMDLKKEKDSRLEELRAHIHSS